MELKTEWSLSLRKEVEVLSCPFCRTREVIQEGDLRFIKSGHDKFAELAKNLG